MAPEALQMLNSRAQLTRSQMSIKRARTPVRQNGRTTLASRQPRRSRTQLNMMPAQDSFPNLQMVQQRPDYAQTSLLQKNLLEAENKERLARDRQRVRSEMQSYKLPQTTPEGSNYDSESQMLQETYEQEYLQQIETEEFQNAAMQKISGEMNQLFAQTRQKQLKRAKENAANKAQDATQQAAQAIKAVASMGKLGWETENLISLADGIDPADFELPTIFNFIVQAYRALTAILNNGKKFLSGPLAVLEPPPLYRFWDMEAAGKLISSGTSDIFNGGSEIENTIESITLGWWQAIIGLPIAIFLSLSIIAIFFFIFLLIAIGASALGML
ncbi:hypothetical protein A2258_01760 [Candidatus Uhrbacteria bacterium RIFOXYA2_FULL_41_8]|nr:MAG: hypothetical protein A2258_01760 [Candidatus Uhrbacteria bacterium RIFOXYA2_FULL_41_8]